MAMGATGLVASSKPVGGCSDASQTPARRKPETNKKEADSQQHRLAIAGRQLAIVWAERAVSLAGGRFSAQPSGLCA